MEEVAKEIGTGLVGPPEPKKTAKKIQEKNLRDKKPKKKICFHVLENFC